MKGFLKSETLIILKKMVNTIILKIQKKHLFLMSALIVFLVGIGLIIGDPSPGESGDPGHNINVIGAPTGCSAGQVLQWTATGWGCVDLPSASTAGSLQCEHAVGSAGDTSIAVCPTGTKVVGGGCFRSGHLDDHFARWASRPGESHKLIEGTALNDGTEVAGNSWFCSNNVDQYNFKAFAICCKVA